MVGDGRRSPSPERRDDSSNRCLGTVESPSPSHGSTFVERRDHFIRFHPRQDDQPERKEAPSFPDNIRIVGTIDKGNSIIAAQNFETREVIFPFIGKLVPLDEATDKSLQITDDLCIESTVDFDNNLNHSCNPNCYIDFTNMKQPVLVAIRNIEKGEELSFNYNATDYDLLDPRCECPFTCKCNAPNCLGEIKGYKYLTPEQKREISPYLAPFLKAIYEKETREHENLGNPCD